MNPQRLSHLRAVVEELSLTLEEMADMDEARRALAHDHEKEARRLVLQAADLAGFTVTATP